MEQSTKKSKIFDLTYKACVLVLLFATTWNSYVAAQSADHAAYVASKALVAADSAEGECKYANQASQSVGKECRALRWASR
jgi:hypothetical protein